VSFFFLEKLEA